jgi:hypothetical protein
LVVATRKCCVGGIGGGARPVEIAHDDRVDFGVERLDAGNRAVDQLARRNLPTGERRHQLAGGAVCRPYLIRGGGRLGRRQGGCGGGRADRGDERAPAWFVFHSCLRIAAQIKSRRLIVRCSIYSPTGRG